MEAAADILQDDCNQTSTRAAMDTKMKAFFMFSDEMGLGELPPSPEDMRAYATWLMLAGHCSNSDSLKQYLSAVRVYCARRGFWVPSPTEWAPLKEVVAGAARWFNSPRQAALPVTIDMFINLARTAPPARATTRQLILLEVLKDTAILLFHTMLRGSSLFPGWPAAACRTRQLTWDRVSVVDGGVVLKILLSKTDQCREKPHFISLKEDGSEFCPVGALARLKRMRGTDLMGSDHVLMIPNDSGRWRPLVKTEFVKWFKARVAEMGYDASKYSTHSFRHGSLALSLELEPNITMVKLQSNHLSQAIMTYSNIPPERRLQVSATMLKAISRTAAARDDHPDPGTRPE